MSVDKTALVVSYIQTQRTTSPTHQLTKEQMKIRLNIKKKPRENNILWSDFYFSLNKYLEYVNCEHLRTVRPLLNRHMLHGGSVISSNLSQILTLLNWKEEKKNLNICSFRYLVNDHHISSNARANLKASLI